MSDNNRWQVGTPQAVIDEIEASLDAETDAYKQWLRDSIAEVKANETRVLPETTSLTRADAEPSGMTSQLSEEDG